MIKPYENNWDYLMAEFDLLDLLIWREVLRSRQDAGREPRESFAGLLISDAEVDRLLSHTLQPAPELEQLDDSRKIIAARRKEIAQRTQASLKHGIYLALPRLVQMFGLAPFEQEAVLICLAPELNLKYEKLFAFLQDDITRKRPTVEVLLKLLCATPAERLQARSLLAPTGTLFRAQILRGQESEEASFPARALRLDDRIVNFLLGIGGLHKEHLNSVRMFSAKHKLDGLRWSKDLRLRLLKISREHLRAQPPSSRKLIYHFYGPPGTGKKTLAASLCAALETPLMVLDLYRIVQQGQNFEETIRGLLREAVLQPTAIFLENYDAAFEKDEHSRLHQQSLAHALEDFSWLTFISTKEHLKSTEPFKGSRFFSIELPRPNLSTRVQIWQNLVKEELGSELDVDWGELAAKFHLTPGQIENALDTARDSALLRESNGHTLTARDLYAGCHAQSNQKLGTLARRLKPRHSWSDITLPPNSLAQLHELCAQMKHRHTVYSEWEFERQMSLQKGLCALFFGQSGTGKTMAVEIIARDLHLEAYKIDLSTVVSKYIGETEKNLSAIFQEAETANAILFFDEADAIFGKRTEVKDAHDRYANLEISYLLQRLEEFDGMVILATNLRKNIDDAFFRRMNFAIEFPFPDEQHRYLIWKQHFPAAAPIAEDIDFNFLAKRINVPGGNIKNIVVNAAFLAAEQKGVIRMEHLIHATRREYEKIGRVCAEVDFAPYQALLRNS